ncbi:hypothetical protein LTR15_002806 [Elasticomyces elasticus]|nr:hypothetical protein LTR15_002806 [Elasticomyces elasticus]
MSHDQSADGHIARVDTDATMSMQSDKFTRRTSVVSNMIGSSLRKRLSKRQAKDDLHSTSPSSDEASSRGSTPSSEVAGANIIPPPPARDSTIRRVSPSDASINSYKSRTPAAVAPATVTRSYKAPATVGNSTISCEQYDYDYESDSGAAYSNTAPTTPGLEKADPVLIAGGNFHVLTGSRTRRTGKRNHSVELLPKDVISKTGEQLLGLTALPVMDRRTRSKERREERADSGSGEAGQAQKKEDEVVKPRGMPRAVTGSVRKLEVKSRTPSPGYEVEIEDADAGLTGPPELTQVIDFAERGMSLSLETTALPVRTHTSTSYSPEHSPEQTTSPSSHFSPPVRSSVKRRIGSTSTLEAGPMIVSPPPYDPGAQSYYQWISSIGSTSRPSEPWGWTKRWTCCSCEAHTIVEQSNCASLSCGHVRCGLMCKVIHGSGAPRQSLH